MIKTIHIGKRKLAIILCLFLSCNACASPKAEHHLEYSVTVASIFGTCAAMQRGGERDNGILAKSLQSEETTSVSQEIRSQDGLSGEKAQNRTEMITNQLADTETTTNKPADTETSANPPANTQMTTNQPADTKTTTNQSADTETTAIRPTNAETTTSRHTTTEATTNQPVNTETTTNRHAFVLENNITFTASIPDDWRYILYPIYDHTYIRELPEEGQESNYNPVVKFIGTGVEDGEDNFFTVTVSAGKEQFADYYSDDFSRLTTTSFVFGDGTSGTWGYRTWEGELLHAMGDTEATYYEGIVQDKDEKCSIHLLMLKEEFDANEQAITEFLKSACIGDIQFGRNENKPLSEKSLLTLHIRDEYMGMSFQIPEGASFWVNDYYNDEDYKVRSYKVYLDQDRHTYFEIVSDQGGSMIDPTGDVRFYLNTEDFEETVYELEGNTSGEYYFPQWHLSVRTNVGRSNEKLWEYIKAVMRSFQLE